MPGSVTQLLKSNNSENAIYSYSVIAIAGIGLIQNANHDFEWVMGPETMMDYYPRILLSQNEVSMDTNQEILPTLTIISLGGNDYNHQNGYVPSQEEFTQGKIIKIISAATMLVLQFRRNS
jgi:hypothetical protein